MLASRWFFADHRGLALGWRIGMLTNPPVLHGTIKQQWWPALAQLDCQSCRFRRIPQGGGLREPVASLTANSYQIAFDLQATGFAQPLTRQRGADGPQ